MTYFWIFLNIHLNIIELRFFFNLLFFERYIKKIFKKILLKTMKKQWFKGAHVAPNNVVGPSYLSNWVYQFIECIVMRKEVTCLV
jgi:hypothetical protein